MRECPKCEACFADDVAFCPRDATETRQTLPGDLLLAARYRLEKRLGRGAMGQVYLARDENLGTRRVAVKTVRQDLLNSESLQEGEAIARFEREARAAASINHPHVVDVTDFGKTDEGVFFLVMEYVEGETLHKLLRREGTLNIKRAIHMLKQVCQGVEAAHDAGILHRDLKPGNIFIMAPRRKTAETTPVNDASTKVEDGFIKVGDFGLAKIMGQTSTDISAATEPASRGIIGTPEFMAPEQMQTDSSVDARADVYALGTIAYLMLGGRTPFTGDLMQLIAQKVMDTPAPLSSLRSDIPIEMEKAVMSALQKEPNRRPASVGDWLAALEKALGSMSQVETRAASRLVVMASVGAEVYLDDVRKGSVGSSGRFVLTGATPGKHILRVSHKGDRDDERLIEIREGAFEQVIQAISRPAGSPSKPSPGSQGSAGGSGIGHTTSLPDVVSCAKCGARYAAGVRFCGRCGGQQFQRITPTAQTGVTCPKCAAKLPPMTKFCGRCGFKLTAGQGSPAGQAPNIHASQPPSHQPPSHPANIRPVQRLCQRCGAAYDAAARFCGKCGNVF
jgi:serine/threonine protein kinase